LLIGAGIGALFIQTEGELWSSTPHTWVVFVRKHGGPPLVGDQGAAAPGEEPVWETEPLEVEDTISRYLT
jgi:hypothetical protein